MPASIVNAQARSGSGLGINGTSGCEQQHRKEGGGRVQNRKQQRERTQFKPLRHSSLFYSDTGWYYRSIQPPSKSNFATCRHLRDSATMRHAVNICRADSGAPINQFSRAIRSELAPRANQSRLRSSCQMKGNCDAIIPPANAKRLRRARVQRANYNVPLHIEESIAPHECREEWISGSASPAQNSSAICRGGASIVCNCRSGNDDG